MILLQVKLKLWYTDNCLLKYIIFIPPPYNHISVILFNLLAIHPYIHTDLRHNRLSNVMYIGMALMFVLSLGLVSAFYMRSMKDKRKRQDAIRSLLDIMSVTSRDSQGLSGVGGGNTISTVGLSSSEYSLDSEYFADNAHQQHTYLYNNVNG